ncbi:MAG: site-specific integrase [Proteobacteria bacterium]|nr:site-specific integrase [Pseudomonadota bacterium]
MQLPKIKRIVTKSGLVRFQMRYLVDGRGSKYKNERFESRQAAQESIVKVLNRKKMALRDSYALDTSFAAEAEYWLSTRGKSVSPSHLKKVNGILVEILPKLGKLKPERFNHGLLADFQADQLERGLQNQTVNHKVQTIKAILRNSFRTKRIVENPSAGFEMLKTLRENIEFWERWEAEAFLSFANQKYPQGNPNRWVYAVYVLALNTGMRSGEIWGLLATNLKSGGRVLYIDHQYDRTVGRMRPTKGKEPRNVPCNTGLKQVLTEVCQTSCAVSKLGTIFCHPDTGDPICHEVFRRQYFLKDLKESGTRAIRFHDLRHTAATLMIDQGVDLVTVSKILGHKDMKTTMLYLHLLPNKIAETAAVFSVLPSSAAPKSVGLRLCKSQ